ncbi:MAG: 4Fe-4S binding protein [Firmicutes bacterium]|nr:4Fe-4S binding protein [Bacillota bacterium]
MAHKIDETKCICCGSCAQVCPVTAISHTPGAKAYWIDPEICIDCDACTSVCPVNCISQE